MARRQSHATVEISADVHFEGNPLGRTGDSALTTLNNVSAAFFSTEGNDVVQDRDGRVLETVDFGFETYDNLSVVYLAATTDDTRTRGPAQRLFGRHMAFNSLAEADPDHVVGPGQQEMHFMKKLGAISFRDLIGVSAFKDPTRYPGETIYGLDVDLGGGGEADELGKWFTGNTKSPALHTLFVDEYKGRIPFCRADTRIECDAMDEFPGFVEASLLIGSRMLLNAPKLSVLVDSAQSHYLS